MDPFAIAGFDLILLFFVFPITTLLYCSLDLAKSHHRKGKETAAYLRQDWRSSIALYAFCFSFSVFVFFMVGRMLSSAAMGFFPVLYAIAMIAFIAAKRARE